MERIYNQNQGQGNQPNREPGQGQHHQDRDSNRQKAGNNPRENIRQPGQTQRDQERNK